MEQIKTILPSNEDGKKVLVPLSEFVKITHPLVCKINMNSIEAMQQIDDYTDYITQPITEKSLEGVECVFYKGRFNELSKWTIESLQYYKTIEHAINDGVLFILKD